jgi:elongation factor 1 alpha-like protein
MPIYPPGRLLGGSSKLKALAAARKKKQEEAQAGATSATPAPERNPETDKAVALLDRLSVKSKDGSASSSVNGNVERKTLSKYPSRKRPISPGHEALKVEEPTTPEETTPSIEIPNLRTEPSMFASTLCGPRGPSSKKPRMESEELPLHYPDSKTSNEANPFAGPSPDDIVLRAQAKSAVHG